VLESQNMVVVRKFIQEAIDENFKLVMLIRLVWFLWLNDD
jgi:hypothetical protein